jgi:hypothetical protein
MFLICDICTDVTYDATQLEALMGCSVYCGSVERQLLAHTSWNLTHSEFIEHWWNISGPNSQ